MPYDVVAFETDELTPFWSAAAEGYWHRLIRKAWINGSLPNDISKLAVLCRCPMDDMPVVWKEIGPSFVEMPGDKSRLINPKQEHERQFVREQQEARDKRDKDLSQRQSVKGRKSGEARRLKRTRTAPKRNSGLAVVEPITNRGSVPVRTEGEPPSPSQPVPTQPVLVETGTGKAAPAGAGPHAPNLDPAYETWAAKFLEHRKVPYAHKRKQGGFVQLAKMREAMKIGTRDVPAGWVDATEHYFASDLRAYSLEHFVSMYDVFLKGPVDRFGHRIGGSNGTGRGRTNGHQAFTGADFAKDFEVYGRGGKKTDD